MRDPLVFEGQVIRLTEKHYNEFYHLSKYDNEQDFLGKLTKVDNWMASKGVNYKRPWFFVLSNILHKEKMDALKGR